jgi:hypothetical protein
LSQYDDVLPRVLARVRGSALPTRRTSFLSADPARVFGVAPIRVVSEQQVQAVAFGLIGARPQVVYTWNPLGRDARYIEPFASALDHYLDTSVAAGELPRIWLPHAPAAEVLDVLGHRFQNNRSATPLLRYMGLLCRALIEELAYPGQQVVAVAGSLLAAHAVTGQSPIEDRQLNSMLAWFEVAPGVDPAAEAERRALTPAAAMLDRSEDDRVEHLRKIGKSRGTGALAARRDIELILERAAHREWDLLVRARDAFWRIGLPPAPGLAPLVAQSTYRIGAAIGPSPRTKGPARLLEEYEYSLDLLEDADVRSDPRVRERARLDGRAVLATVVRIDQPVRNQHPCTLVLHTTQEILRVRRGTALRAVDGSLTGRVERRPEPLASGYEIVLRLKTGVRNGRRLAVGATIDLVGTAPFNAPMMKRPVYDTLYARRPALIFDATLPAASPRRIPPGSLAAAADALRSS